MLYGHPSLTQAYIKKQPHALTGLQGLCLSFYWRTNLISIQTLQIPVISAIVCCLFRLGSGNGIWTHELHLMRVARYQTSLFRSILSQGARSHRRSSLLMEWRDTVFSTPRFVFLWEVFRPRALFVAVLSHSNTVQRYEQFWNYQIFFSKLFVSYWLCVIKIFQVAVIRL